MQAVISVYQKASTPPPAALKRQCNSGLQSSLYPSLCGQRYWFVYNIGCHFVFLALRRLFACARGYFMNIFQNCFISAFFLRRRRLVAKSIPGRLVSEADRFGGLLALEGRRTPVRSTAKLNTTLLLGAVHGAALCAQSGLWALEEKCESVNGPASTLCTY